MPPDPVIYQRAARMRRALTPPEAHLWACLKGGKVHGAKFRRQHPVGGYILDFYCPSAKLAIEIDGVSHETDERTDYDRRRTAWLADQGIEVMRFRAVSIRDHLDAVIEAIAPRVSGR